MEDTVGLSPIGNASGDVKGRPVGGIPVGDLVVVRFMPYRVEKLTEQAEDEARACSIDGREACYSISTLAERLVDGDLDTLLLRVCTEAIPKGKKICVTSEPTLEAIGLTVRRSEPPTRHHDVVFGSELDEAVVQTLSTLFEQCVRSNPAWTK